MSKKGKGKQREREREREGERARERERERKVGEERRKDVRLRCVIFNHRLLVFVIHG